MEIIDSINIINTLMDQTQALSDLMQMVESSVDIKSIKTVVEMQSTMLDEISAEVEKIYQHYKEEGKLRAQMCDEYCRYTHEEGGVAIDEICSKCPMSKL